MIGDLHIVSWKDLMTKKIRKVQKKLEMGKWY